MGRAARATGPAAPACPKRPADLTAPHTGQHTAGDLFWWVTHGIPIGGMPGFGSALATEDRWDVINFLRALSAAPGGADPEPAGRARPGLARRARLHLRGRALSGAELEGAARASDGAARAVLAARVRPRLQRLAEVYGELQFLGTEIIAVPMDADPRILARLGGDPADSLSRRHRRRGRHRAAPIGCSRAPREPSGLRPAPPAPAHMELLIDRQGYIRARWIPDEGPAELERPHDVARRDPDPRGRGGRAAAGRACALMAS